MDGLIKFTLGVLYRVVCLFVLLTKKWKTNLNINKTQLLYKLYIKNKIITKYILIIII